MSNDDPRLERIDPALASTLHGALAEELVDFDPALAARLRIARQRALVHDERYRDHWPWRPAAVLAISVAAIALVVDRTNELSPITNPASPIALEAGATSDDLAVSEDLDFYTWLASRDSSG
jgi:hypothetical protein